MARLLDGTALAADVRADVARGAAAFRARTGRAPGLRVVLVGAHPASESYVRAKERAAREAGLDAETLRLPATATTAEILALVARLNADAAIDGILVQLPLPAAVDTPAVVRAVDPDKDVDGFHPVNVGKLWLGEPALAPCTPAGIAEMLKRADVPTAGAHAVVVGRSDIVGKPMAGLLLRLDATVTVCHSRTRDLPALARQADILVAAVGRAGFVTADMVRPGAVVIDVGINRVDDASRERGYRLTGDVDFAAVEPVAGAITPVPGGVGPMTIAMLLANTVQAAEARASAARDSAARA